jgi:hypothetical protein
MSSARGAKIPLSLFVSSAVSFSTTALQFVVSAAAALIVSRWLCPGQ